MRFVQNGGLTTARFHLVSEGHHLEAAAAEALTTPGRETGIFVCQCRYRSGWQLSACMTRTGQEFCYAGCNCNGSSLPFYIGSPPIDSRFGILTEGMMKWRIPLRQCPRGHVLGDTTRREMRERQARGEDIISILSSPHHVNPSRIPYPEDIAIGIGYAGPVPALGTVDVERAQELVVVRQCDTCQVVFTAWELRLPEPYPIAGNEPWVRRAIGRG